MSTSAGRSNSTANPSDSLHAQEMGSVMAQLFNRLTNIGQRLVRTLLGRLWQIGPPTLHQNFEGADIKIAVVKKSLELWHMTRHEATILANRIPAHG